MHAHMLYRFCVHVMIPDKTQMSSALTCNANSISTLQIMGKLEIIPGDLGEPQCGICEDDQLKLLSEVQYIVHAAASIQFDNHIHTDLTLSYVATKTIADFATKVNCAAIPDLRSTAATYLMLLG